MAVTANPNIIMGFKAPQIANPMAIAAQGEQIRSARNQNAMAEATLAAAPAKALQERKDKAMAAGKQLLGMVGSAEEFNQKLDSVVGGDASEFHITPENFATVQARMFPQKQISQPKNQIVQDSSGTYSIDSFTGKATKVEGVGGKTFAPRAPAPDKLSLGGDESGQYIVNLTTGEKRPILGAKTAPIKPVAISENTANEAEDAIAAVDRLLNSDLSKIYGIGEDLYPDRLRGQEGVDMMADRDTIANSLVLARMGQMKGLGPVSNADGAIIEKAASDLKNPNISDKKAYAELKRVREIFVRTMNNNRPKQSPQGGEVTTQISPDDLAAKQWAESNINDPVTGENAKRILRELDKKGIK